jgi:AcrR family transcriptional regulator
VSELGGTRRRRAVSEEDKSRRRGEIMTAAKTVFARSGFYATTIAHIAKEAGLAYGSVYWYFDSKDELFHALMSAEGDALRAHIAAAVTDTGERPGKDWEPLRVTVQAVLEFFEADKAVTKVLLRDAYALGDQFEKHLGSIYERFIDDIEKQIIVAQQLGTVISAPPRMLAFSLAALIGQLAHRRLSTDDGVTAGEVADIVVSFSLNGLRPRESWNTTSGDAQG